ncbi:unnamed protein product, partial [Strongylus vulgaris]
ASDRNDLVEVERQVEALRKRIRKAKNKLAVPTKSTTTPAVEEEGVEGDTARALEWMIANAAKMVDEKANVPIVDKIPVDRVDAAAGTEPSHLSSGVEVISEQDQFVLKEDLSNDPVVKVDRRIVDVIERTDGKKRRHSTYR